MIKKSELNNKVRNANELCLLCEKLGFNYGTNLLGTFSNGAKIDCLFDFLDDNPGVLDVIVDFIKDNSHLYDEIEDEDEDEDED